MQRSVFTIELTKSAYCHLEALKRSDRNRILDSITAQLTHRPLEATRNKKFLRPNPLADWELRVDSYRVFYDVNNREGIVRILAIGKKEHNTLIIHGEEVTL